jgi:Domain of unknown function (DUF4190)
MPSPYGPPVPSKPTDGMAIAALVVGIIGPCCGGILSPAAFFLGLAARGRIRDSGGAVQGDGFALTGIVLGVAGTIELILLIIVIVIIRLASNQ